MTGQAWCLAGCRGRARNPLPGGPRERNTIEIGRAADATTSRTIRAHAKRSTRSSSRARAPAASAAPAKLRSRRRRLAPAGRRRRQAPGESRPTTSAKSRLSPGGDFRPTHPRYPVPALRFSGTTSRSSPDPPRRRNRSRRHGSACRPGRPQRGESVMLTSTTARVEPAADCGRHQSEGRRRHGNLI